MGQKKFLNLIDDEDSNFQFIRRKIPNSPEGHQLLSQVKQNLWIFKIGGEEPIATKVSFDELQ